MKRLAFGISSSACGLILLLAGTFVWALNESSHSLINQEATNRSSLNAFLQEHLGMPDGIKTPIRGATESRRVEQWIQLGGAREDESTYLEYLTGKARSFRHFHDPLLAWDRSGLFYPLTIPPRITRFESSIRWAQRSDQDRESGHGNFSWPSARQYFLSALTDPDSTRREQAFADTFRALGQLMHLVGDASVPEHVRNDPHPMATVQDKFGQVGNYEYWVQAQHMKAGTEAAFIRDYLSTPISLDPELLQIAISSTETIARVPIARLFDSDRYTGSNPDVTAESRIGIAETANANFVSEDTGYGQYPHPALANLPKYIGTYSKVGEKRSYYRKEGAGLSVDPVAAECVLDEATGVATFCKDENVWRQTARHMLPRAVRYGQEVLDYFFRGKLEVSREPDPATGLPSLRIVNRSSEPLGEGGVLTLYQDTDKGERSPVQGATLTLTAAVPKDSDAPLLPVPADLPSGGITLVYRGPLGRETDAVIGKVLPEVVVEEVYRDWDMNEWILRTKDGLYVLPLAAVAGLSAPPAMVRWGDRGNQLVAVTAGGTGGGGDLAGGPESGGPQTYLALLFELERPLGSPAVPTTETPSPSGRPVAKLQLVNRVPLYDVLGSIDLNTTVEFTEHLGLTQYLVTYATRTVCQDDETRPNRGIYNCTETTFGETLRQVKDWSDTVRATFPLGLTPDHHAASQWDARADRFRWYVAELRADRAGRLLAVIVVETTHLTDDEGRRSIPLVVINEAGEIEETPTVVTLRANIADPQISVILLVDLTGRKLLAKSSADVIRVEKTHRTVVPASGGNLYVARHSYVEVHGGLDDGSSYDWWAGESVTPGLPPGPTRNGLALADHELRSYDSVEGLFRENLGALGLGAVEARGTGGGEGQGRVFAYRYDSDGTYYLLRTSDLVSITLGPAQQLGGIRWSGPLPGWLRFQAAAREAGPDILGMTRAWFVNWNLEADAVSLAYAETTQVPLLPVTSNLRGVLTMRQGKEDASSGWLWIPWTGSPVGLALPPRPLFGELGPVALPYVALDPDYLYNAESGRFHAVRPEAPALGEPPLLVPKPDTGGPPFLLSDWGWEQGRYHVVGW